MHSPGSSGRTPASFQRLRFPQTLKSQPFPKMAIARHKPFSGKPSVRPLNGLAEFTFG